MLDWNCSCASCDFGSGIHCGCFVTVSVIIVYVLIRDILLKRFWQGCLASAVPGVTFAYFVWSLSIFLFSPAIRIELSYFSVLIVSFLFLPHQIMSLAL